MTDEEVYSHLKKIQAAPTFVEMLVKHAAGTGVSDIHIDCGRKGTVIRLRRRGILGIIMTGYMCPHHEIIARFKVLAAIRTDEHMTAHDGRIRYVVGEDASVDLRLSIVPTYHGENCVIRILAENARAPTFAELGMLPEYAELLSAALSNPQGCICIVGPTGSGKTTTLYACLRYLQDQSRAIVTIEDPVEYELENIRQVQTAPLRGLTFAAGLRALLRQDPDIIMVGEIRDRETAGITLNAALTGHLVLVSLHAKNCIGAFSRLFDIGLDMPLVASAVSLVIAQRLVRTVCTDCRGAVTGDGKETACQVCTGTGYGGQQGIYEFLPVDATVRNALREGRSLEVLLNRRKKHVWKTLRTTADELVAQGVTTAEEVARVFGTGSF